MFGLVAAYCSHRTFSWVSFAGDEERRPVMLVKSVQQLDLVG